MSTTIREAILARSRLARMRLGQLAPETIVLPSMQDIRLAQVPLTEDEAQRGIILASNLNVGDNLAGMNARNRAAMQSDAWLSLRVPEDLTQLVFGSIEEMVKTLEPSDIDLTIDSLATLMDHASPALDGLTDKDLGELKKGLLGIEWSALTGRQWAVLKLACTILLPQLLQAKLSGSGSTEPSTTKSANEESTSSV